MGVQLHEENEGKVLIVKVSGKLSKEDYQQLVPEVERLIEKVGKLHLLLEMHDFHGWDAGALWEDIKFDVKHFKDIERLAFVGEKKWEKGMSVFCKPFTTARIKYFDLDEIEQAREWVGVGTKAPA